MPRKTRPTVLPGRHQALENWARGAEVNLARRRIGARSSSCSPAAGMAETARRGARSAGAAEGARQAPREPVEAGAEMLTGS